MMIANSSGGGIAGTLDSNYHKGCGERQGIEREYLVMTDEADNSTGIESESRNDNK